MMNYWVYLMLNDQASVSSSILHDLNTLKSLIMVCKSVSLSLKPFIEHKFWFSQEKNEKMERYTWYSPKQIKSLHPIFVNKIKHFFGKIEYFPSSTTHIRFCAEFNDKIDFLTSSKITHLTFGRNFNEHVNNLPQTITHLEFGYYFNKPVDHLPKAITHLEFGYYFNEPVDSLPPNITHLMFGINFNRTVNHLPQKITHLTFGINFNRTVNHLPQTITHLEFGLDFNKPVDISHKA